MAICWFDEFGFEVIYRCHSMMQVIPETVPGSRSSKAETVLSIFSMRCMLLVQDIELSQRDSFQFTKNLSFSAAHEGVTDHDAEYSSSHCVNSTSEDEELSFEGRQTATDSVSDVGDEPLETAAASPPHFREGEDGIKEEELEVFGGDLDSEIDIEQIEMH